ncbi:MAG: OB-fold nucleic acid binding domain-containing protein, partial [Firmicutes bacterium]|nr:OB-fold nucleic acid binding domain-containing protein [Bacillota bacterium]
MSFRTVWANQIDLSLAGSEVMIAGWVQRRRDHGGLIFVDIRDRTGIVQVVAEPQGPVFPLLDSLRAEYVVSITGIVQKRPEGMVNREIASGDVEIVPIQVKVLSQSKTPPFMPQEAESVDELVRLKYRYVDLRRPSLFNNFALRDKVLYSLRTFFHEQGFLEVE